MVLRPAAAAAEAAAVPGTGAWKDALAAVVAGTRRLVLVGAGAVGAADDEDALIDADDDDTVVWGADGLPPRLLPLLLLTGLFVR